MFARILGLGERERKERGYREGKRDIGEGYRGTRGRQGDTRKGYMGGYRDTGRNAGRARVRYRGHE